MGLFDFVRDAGEKLFGRAKTDDPGADLAKAEALAQQVKAIGLQVEDLHVEYADGVARVRGTTPSQAEREKIILLLGNTQGVSQVDDQLAVKIPEPAATLYTVKPGDTLSKIAKAHYGSAGQYPVIFEANRPMLKDPDKIYPGQVLRIPPQSI